MFILDQIDSAGRCLIETQFPGSIANVTSGYDAFAIAECCHHRLVTDLIDHADDSAGKAMNQRN